MPLDLQKAADLDLIIHTSKPNLAWVEGDAEPCVCGSSASGRFTTSSAPLLSVYDVSRDFKKCRYQLYAAVNCRAAILCEH